MNERQFKFTEYFENEVLRKRSYIKKDWCIKIIENPIKSEKQEDNRYRFWGAVDELKGKVFGMFNKLCPKHTVFTTNTSIQSARPSFS